MTAARVVCAEASRSAVRNAEARGLTLTPFSCVECQRRLVASPRAVVAIRNSGATTICERCAGRLELEGSLAFVSESVEPLAHPQGPLGYLADRLTEALIDDDTEPEPARAEQTQARLDRVPNIHPSRYRRRPRGR